MFYIILRRKPDQFLGNYSNPANPNGFASRMSYCIATAKKINEIHLSQKENHFLNEVMCDSLTVKGRRKEVVKVAISTSIK